jgi:hypothetical protein
MLRLSTSFAVAVILTAATLPMAVGAEAGASTAPTSQAATPVENLSATCIRVKGTVQRAPVGAKSTDAAAWKPVEVAQTYGAGTQIRTGIRSSALFRFGDDTVVLVDRSTLAAISEFYKTADSKRTRIGLDYGSVRAGVAEGGLRSDFVIDTPVATLSKRGTWDFAMWVERGTGRFEVRLADRGLVEVLQKASGKVAEIRPSQFVTQAMLTWADMAKFDRQVVVADAFSQTSTEQDVYARTNTGRAGLTPSGQPPYGVAGAPVMIQPPPQVQGGNAAATLGTAFALTPGFRVPIGPVRATEGNFGAGSGVTRFQLLQWLQPRVAQQRAVVRPPPAKR